MYGVVSQLMGFWTSFAARFCSQWMYALVLKSMGVHISFKVNGCAH